MILPKALALGVQLIMPVAAATACRSLMSSRCARELPSRAA